jgi:hypothetical protein
MPPSEPFVDPLDEQGPLTLPDPVPGVAPVKVVEEEQTSRRRRAHAPLEPKVQIAVGACVVLGGLGAALASPHPTGGSVVDAVLTFGFAAAVILASSVARRWTWLVLSGTAVVLAAPLPARLLAIVALLVAFHGAAIATKRSRIAGAIVAALSMQGLLRAAHIGFHGSTALIVAAVTIPVLVSGYRASQRRTRQRTRLGLKIAGVAVAVAVLGLGVALLMARQSLQAAVSESHKGLDAALAGKQGEAAKQWGLASISFRDASHNLDQPWAKGAQLVPILAQHAKAVTEASKSGVDISRTATVAALTAPYRDLRSDNGQVNIPLIRKMQQPVADTQAALVRAKSSIAGIDTKWLVSPVASQLTEYRKQINRALPEANTAHQALMVAPGLLGGNGTRHYLILFSTPAESRYLGGFIGSWAELTATNGKLKITRHGRSGTLDDALPPEGAKLTGVDQFLARYSRFSPESFFQNVSASPDFPTVDKVASQLYPQAGGEKVDGTMYVDPIALAALLKLSGPVHVDGLSYPLTSSNAAQFLLHDQYTQFPISSDRTDFLSAASTATFDALTKRKLPTVPHITDTLDPIVRQHRLLFISHTPSELAFLQRIGLKGALPNPDGSDFLSVRTSNGNPNKIDYYLNRIVQDSVRYDPRTGYVNATITVWLKNTAPTSGLPDYVIGNDDITAGILTGQPRGSNNVLMSIYSGLGHPTATIDGKAANLEVERELGHNVYTVSVLVPSGATGVVTLHVSGTIARSSVYRLVVPVQPLVHDDGVVVVVRSDTPKATVAGPHAKDGRVVVPIILRSNRVVTVPFRAS